MAPKWMVDCNGDEGEAGASDMIRALGDLDFAGYIERQGGLASSVQRAIVDYGASITDRGGGGGRWHIGVPFDDLDDAKDYLDYMTRTFSSAIASGSLRFALKTWSREAWGGAPIASRGQGTPAHEGDWFLLENEPCRFCHKVGCVYFLGSDGRHQRDDDQPMRCDACGRSWQSDSPCA